MFCKTGIGLLQEAQKRGTKLVLIEYQISSEWEMLVKIRKFRSSAAALALQSSTGSWSPGYCALQIHLFAGCRNTLHQVDTALQEALWQVDFYQ